MGPKNKHTTATAYTSGVVALTSLRGAAEVERQKLKVNIILFSFISLIFFFFYNNPEK